MQDRLVPNRVPKYAQIRRHLPTQHDPPYGQFGKFAVKGTIRNPTVVVAVYLLAPGLLAFSGQVPSLAVLVR